MIADNGQEGSSLQAEEELPTKQISKEKQYFLLIQQYKKAINFLKKRQSNEGKGLLKNTIEEIYLFNGGSVIRDKKLEELNFSCLLSLAEVQCESGNLRSALELYYHVAVSKDEFNLWMKIANLCERGNFYEQAAYTLKKAYRKAPHLWKQEVLQRLLGVYRKDNKLDCAKDLQSLLANQFQIDIIMQEEREAILATQKHQGIDNQVSKKARVSQLFGQRIHQKYIDPEDSLSLIEASQRKPYAQYYQEQMKIVNSYKNVHLTLYRDKNQHKWEYIMTLIYVLLKGKSERGFAGKKYLKKYDSPAKAFFQSFHPAFSKVYIELAEKQLEKEKQLALESKGESMQGPDSNRESFEEARSKNSDALQNFSIKDYVRQFMTHQAPNKKRKNRKKQDQVQLPVRLPFLPSGTSNNKKGVPAMNYRTNYTNLAAYFRQINIKNDFKLEELNKLTSLQPNRRINCNERSSEKVLQGQLQRMDIQLNNSIYDRIFNQVLVELVQQQPQKALKQNQQNEEKQIQPSKEDKKKQAPKEPTPEQKLNLLLTQHFDYYFDIETNSKHSHQYGKMDVQEQESSIPQKEYNSVYHLAQQTISYLLFNGYQDTYRNTSALQVNSWTNFFLEQPFLKKMLKKTIVKLIQQTGCFIDELANNGWLIGETVVNSMLSSQTHPKLKSAKASATLLELLVEKVQQISYKNYKSKDFRNYQLCKLKEMTTFIKQRYEIQVFLQLPQKAKGSNETQHKQNNFDYVCSLLKKSMAFVRFYTVYGNVSKPSLQLFAHIYKHFIEHQGKHLQINTVQNWTIQTDQGSVGMPKSTQDLQIFIQNRIKRANHKLGSMNQANNKQQSVGESEQKVLQNIDQFLRNQSDSQSVKVILSLISTLSSQSDSSEQVRPKIYMKCFIELLNIFFKKLTSSYSHTTSHNKKYEFNSRMLLPMVEHFKLEKILSEVQKNLVIVMGTESKNGENSVISQDMVLELLYLLVKLYLLGPFDEQSSGNTNCFRIILFLTNYQLRQFIPEEQKGNLIVEIAILYYSMIESKKKSDKEMFAQLKKKYYQNLLSKYIKYIYNSSLFLHNDSVTEKILSIFEGVYYDKDKQFYPKKIEDALGYFIYMHKAHAKTFQCKEIDLSPQVSKIFRRCYRLFAENYQQVYQYCQKFKQFSENFMEIISRINLNKGLQQSSSQKIHFIRVCRGQAEICNCCNIKNRDKYLLGVLFVIGKYFETQQTNNVERNFDEQGKKGDFKFGRPIKDKEQAMEQQNIQEKYYLQLLMLDLEQPSSWENIVRVNCSKAIQYFDSLTLSTDSETPNYTYDHKYKDAFLQTKKLGNFIKVYLGERFKNTTQNLNLLNTIKVCERRYACLTSEALCQWGKIFQLKEKYQDGLRTVCEKFVTQDIRSKYLGLVQLKYPTLLIEERQSLNLRTTTFLQNFGKTPIQEQNRLLQNVRRILQEDLLPLCKLYTSEEANEVYNVKHLEEDLIVEFYVFLLKILQLYTGTIMKLQKLSPPSYNQSLRKLVATLFKQLAEVIIYVMSQEIQSQIFVKYRLVQNSQPQKHHPERQEYLKCNLLPTSKQSQKDQSEKKGVSPSQESEKLYNVSKEGEDLQVLPIQRSNNAQQVELVNQLTIQPSVDFIETFLRENAKHVSIDTNLKGEFDVINVFLRSVLKVLDNLPQLQTKRYRFRRSVTTSALWASRIYFYYCKDYQKALGRVKDYYNLKTDDIVFVYHRYERISTEKNQMLAQYYNRSIVYMVGKMEFMMHLMRIFAEGDIDSLINILKKILKVTQVSGTEKELKVIKPFYILFLYGLSLLVPQFEKRTKQSRIDVKYERTLVDWKNRIKKINSMLLNSTSKEEFKDTLSLVRLENFIQDYEQNHSKMRAKKKKQNQDQTDQIKEIDNDNLIDHDMREEPVQRPYQAIQNNNPELNIRTIIANQIRRKLLQKEINEHANNLLLTKIKSGYTWKQDRFDVDQK